MFIQLCSTLIAMAGIAFALTIQQSTSPKAHTCLYNGVHYPEGAFRPSPCEFCECRGGQPMCAIADCFITNCVDAVHDPDQCCPQCPNGHNCLTPDNVTLAAGQTHVTKDGQKCKCDTFGTRAVCTAPLHSGCTYQGNHYPVGSFQPSPCMYCTCPHNGGQPFCAIQDCAMPPCPNPTNIPGHCCPVCNSTITHLHVPL